MEVEERDRCVVVTVPGVCRLFVSPRGEVLRAAKVRLPVVGEVADA